MTFIERLLYPYRLRARAARQRRLDDIVIRAIKSVRKKVEAREPAIFKDMFHGATGTDPRHLVVCYVFRTNGDLEMARLSGLTDTLETLTREALAARDYPPAAVPLISVTFSSNG